MTSELRAECYDCGLDYEDFPADMIIQDELWIIISPNGQKDGALLCPNCICRRLIRKVGLSSVKARIDVSELGDYGHDK